MKRHLIDELRTTNGLSKTAAEEHVEIVFGAAKRAIEKHGRLQLPGFGTFERKQQAERQGRNPATGEAITIPAKAVTKFRESKA